MYAKQEDIVRSGKTVTQKMEMAFYIVKKLNLNNRQNSDTREYSMMKENNIENTAYY